MYTVGVPEFRTSLTGSIGGRQWEMPTNTHNTVICNNNNNLNKKGSPYSTAECRVLGLIPVLGSQPAGDASPKPGSRLPLLSARPAVTLATLKRAATCFAAR